MKLRLFILAMAAFCSVAFCASDVVWTLNEDDITKPAAYWYKFNEGTGAKATHTTKNGIQKGVLTVSTTKETQAGFGFAWKQTCDEDTGECVDGYISLNSYNGVCLTYRANAPFRVDFKQKSIKDFNYYGTNMVAKEDFASVFIDFTDLKQEWVSKNGTIPLNLGVQEGVQFVYKNTFAKKNGETNTIEISELTLGDGCPTFPTEVLPPYDKDGERTLLEGDIATYDLSKMFSDKDGDAQVTVSIISGKSYITILDAKETYTLKDIVKVTTKPNVDGESIITFTADDGIHTAVSYSETITVENRENNPVAKNDSYTVNEDEVLTVYVVKGILANDYDPDDPENQSEEESFILFSNTIPKNGTLELNEDGSFVYTPNKDFFGTDTWTYTIASIKDNTMESEPGTVTITVKPVNDKPVVEISDDSFLKDTLKVKEDFDPDEVDAIIIPTASVLFSDPDGATTLTIGVYTNGLINASYKKIASNHTISLTPVLNANGNAKIYLFATDGLDTVSVTIPVLITPEIDKPLALPDTIQAYEDSTITISAKNGVLANDINPDDPNVPLIAILEKTTSHGELEFNEDGSFIYTPEEDYVGEDFFTYFAITDDENETESDIVKVILNIKDMNDPPKVTLENSIIDTTIVEDYARNITYARARVMSWFKDPDNDPLTYTAKNEDGKLTVTMPTSGALQIKAAKDSVGDAYVTVTASDSLGGYAEVKIHVLITPVNDKPVLLAVDTNYVKDLENWSLKIPLLTRVTDIDGDTLVFTPNVSIALAKRIDVEVDKDTLYIKAKENVKFEQGELIGFGVKAQDATTYVTVGIFIVFGTETPGTNDFIYSITENRGRTWQNAIMAKHGSAFMFDMQGRLIWKAKLPAFESDVRSAATNKEGYKVLKINKETWVIK